MFAVRKQKIVQYKDVEISACIQTTAVDEA